MDVSKFYRLDRVNVNDVCARVGRGGQKGEIRSDGKPLPLSPASGNRIDFPFSTFPFLEETHFRCRHFFDGYLVSYKN